ncbi:restriction endonuclease [Priestia megaterium]|uniref:restriction endonuclease n=1 Tax=Priestia megaterium TaxID=1404 RepID=UPI00387947D9
MAVLILLLLIAYAFIQDISSKKVSLNNEKVSEYSEIEIRHIKKIAKIWYLNFSKRKINEKELTLFFSDFSFYIMDELEFQTTKHEFRDDLKFEKIRKRNNQTEIIIYNRQSEKFRFQVTGEDEVIKIEKFFLKLKDVKEEKELAKKLRSLIDKQQKESKNLFEDIGKVKYLSKEHHLIFKDNCMVLIDIDSLNVIECNLKEENFEYNIRRQFGDELEFVIFLNVNFLNVKVLQILCTPKKFEHIDKYLMRIRTEMEKEIEENIEKRKVEYLKNISEKITLILSNKSYRTIVHNFFLKSERSEFLFLSNLKYTDDILEESLRMKLENKPEQNDALIENELHLYFIKPLVELFLSKKVLSHSLEGYLVCWQLLKDEAEKFHSKIMYKEIFAQCSVEQMSIDECLEIFINTSLEDIDNEIQILKFIYFLRDNNKISKDDKIHLQYDDIYIRFKRLLDDKKIVELEKSLLNNHDIANYRRKLNIDDIDLMKGIEFENFIAELFRKMGFNSQVTKSSGDQGIDVIAERNGLSVGIQTKCYSGKVSNKAVQEVVAGLSLYKLEKGIVVTNNYFTDSAIDLANSNSIVLWNRDILKEKVAELF